MYSVPFPPCRQGFYIHELQNLKPVIPGLRVIHLYSVSDKIEKSYKIYKVTLIEFFNQLYAFYCI